MKKALFILGGVLLLAGQQAFAQRKCGAEQRMAAIIAQHPEAAAYYRQQKASLQAIADNYALGNKAGAAEKSTSLISPVPVIFHIIVDSAQFTLMGGTTGIIERVDSQIVVLDRDYNKQNLDWGLIPSSWLPLYASVGVHFGSAHTDPSGLATPGYEIKIVPASTAFPAGSGAGTYPDAKHASSGGLDAWDVTKYMNVWCIYFSDDPTLLGITTPKSDVTAGWAPANEEGICITYLALGSQTSPGSLTFPSGGNYYKGRTLTHEAGHFFEIWHTWGDDGGLCPWGGGGGDDGLADTPPEGDAHYGVPAYTITGGTINDGCQYNGATNEQPIGIACLDFLNYTDDIAMYMFTTDQANAMASKVLVSSGESYSLTQNPDLLNYPPGTSVANVAANIGLNIFPNPSTGIVNIALGPGADDLQQVTVTNIMGHALKNINTTGQRQNYYSMDLSAIGKGIYFVRCNFASGSITRKIVLQ